MRLANLADRIAAAKQIAQSKTGSTEGGAFQTAYKTAMRFFQRHTDSGAVQKNKTVSKKTLETLENIAPELKEKVVELVKPKDEPPAVEPPAVEQPAKKEPPKIEQPRAARSWWKQAREKGSGRSGKQRIKIFAKYKVYGSSKDRTDKVRGVNFDLTASEAETFFGFDDENEAAKFLKQTDSGRAWLDSDAEIEMSRIDF